MAQLAAVILAAGKGTRMKSRLPKVLHPIAGRAMVEYVIRAAQEAGVERSVLVVGHDAERVRAHLGDEVEYAIQPEQLGTGDAVAAARRLLADGPADVLVLYGDTPLLTAETLRALVGDHRMGGATLTFLSCAVPEPAGLGRVIRAAGGAVADIVEEREATPEQRLLREINCGVYCFRASWLWPNLDRLERRSGGEAYLTDLVRLAVAEGHRVRSVDLADPGESLGVNTRVQLAEAEAVIRHRIRRRIMLAGVTLVDPASTFVDDGVEIGEDSVLEPFTIVRGRSVIGEGCTIGPGAVLVNAAIGRSCRIVASTIEDSTVADGGSIGPYSHVRGGSCLADGVHLGNYAEVKNSRLGARTKMGHFSYVGDATVGADVNIGAGTVTCNFDGKEKHRTVIGERVFIGSDTMLVAPVVVGDGARTGAGAVVTRDVPPGRLAYGVPARLRDEKSHADPSAAEPGSTGRR
ncbi:MAG: bifunctional UDP-N-acetylglucosamine diphosphorylase/glucosamine-1-phosphate N-acetyltransferase GlmU [Chloroflexi bacterium]|nr:bifunctional UDP-N-acetylglucosamine diphosphorylase/glucosamine-1-phosphate N-acetyltransferase GlmU [Chloroflexota bacterium]